MGRPSKYSLEFREQAVELVRATGKTVAEVARDLSINDTTLGNWVKADNAERGGACGADEAASPEQQAQGRAGDLEESGGLLRDGVDEVTRFAFVDRDRALYDVTVLCSLLKVSRSGFYAWTKWPPSAMERSSCHRTPRARARRSTQHRRRVRSLSSPLRECFSSGRRRMWLSDVVRPAAMSQG